MTSSIPIESPKGFRGTSRASEWSHQKTQSVTVRRQDSDIPRPRHTGSVFYGTRIMQVISQARRPCRFELDQYSAQGGIAELSFLNRDVRRIRRTTCIKELVRN